MKISPSRLARVAFGVMFLCVAPLKAGITIKPVIIGGDRAPGTEDGVVFSTFENVQINDRGEVLFIGNLQSGGVRQDRNEGIWKGAPGDLILAAREGDEPELAGFPDIEFAFFGAPILTDSGTAMFYAQIRGPSISTDTQTAGNDDTIWAVQFIPKRPGEIVPEGGRVARGRRRGNDTELKVIWSSMMQAGVRCEDIAGKVCYFLKDIIELSNAFGYAVFEIEARGVLDYKRSQLGLRAPREEEEAVTGLLGSNASALSLVTTQGRSAPGTEAMFQSFHDITQSRGKRSAVLATTTTPGERGIWLGAGNALRPGPVSGGSVPDSLLPDLGNGATWRRDFNSTIGLNARGEVAFTNGLSSNQVLVAGQPDSLRFIARQRQGQNDGFLELGKNLVINTAGDVAFIGRHTDLGEFTFNNGLWMTHQHGPPVRVLGEGEAAPGLAAGEVISFLDDGPYMNWLGQVVMRAGIGPAAGVANREDIGLWLINPGETPQLVVRGGTMIDIGGGERRELLPNFAVAFFNTHNQSFSGGADGRPSPFNDQGQVVFVAQWENPGGGLGRGVFVANDPEVSLDYDTWAKDLHRLEGAQAEASADPNRNGVPNLVEFALNGIPDAPSTALALPRIMFGPDRRPILVTFKAPGIRGVRIEPQRSSDGETWTSNGLTIVEDDQFLQARVDNPSETELFRLKVSLVDQ